MRAILLLLVFLTTGCSRVENTEVFGVTYSYTKPEGWFDARDRKDWIYPADPDLHLGDLIDDWQSRSLEEKYELREEVYNDTRLIVALYETDPNVIDPHYNAYVEIYLWEGWTSFPYTYQHAEEAISNCCNPDWNLNSDEVIAIRLEDINFYGYEAEYTLGVGGVEGELRGTYFGTPLIVEYYYSEKSQKAKILKTIESITVKGV